MGTNVDDELTLPQRTIAVSIQGGLGNRLFQLAGGLALARLFSAKFAVGPKSYHHWVDPAYIAIERAAATASAGPGGHGPGVDWTAFDVDIARTYDEVWPAVCAAAATAFDSGATTFTVHNGFFQSAAYFEKVGMKAEILERFGPPPAFVENIRERFPSIEGWGFLHVRRGDYCGTGFDMSLDAAYYPRAVAAAAAGTGSPLGFYIFSDDPEWCANYPPIRALAAEGRARIVRGLDPMSSIWMMSLCGWGGICSNSTFSWWGGYLNRNPRKRVIWPIEWYLDKYAFDGVEGVSAAA